MKKTVIVVALSLALYVGMASAGVNDCFVTKVTSDLDGPLPTATFWGTFCDSPTVSIGQTDGSLQDAIVLSSAPGFVTVDLTGNADPMDALVRIECAPKVCDWKLTIGAVGPTGPTGPTGPDDPDLPELKDQLCAVSSQLGLPLPSFCTCPCFDAQDLVDLLTGRALTCFFDDVNNSLLFGDTGNDTLAALHVVPIESCIWWLNDQVISTSHLTPTELVQCEAEIRTAAAQLGESCPDIP